jgi:hypothetical protein
LSNCQRKNHTKTFKNKRFEKEKKSYVETCPNLSISQFGCKNIRHLINKSMFLSLSLKKNFNEKAIVSGQTITISDACLNAYREGITKKTNEYRAKHKVANLDEDKTVQAFSQKYANELVTTIRTLKHSSGSGKYKIKRVFV